MAVVIMPPSVRGLYFCRAESNLSERDREGLEQASTLLLPPPAGLDDIIRIGVSQQSEKPEAIAPDPKRMARSVRQALTARGVPSALVSHDEVIQSRAALAQKHPHALQCTLMEIAKQGTRKSGAYRTRLTFSLVETRSGRTLLEKTVEATCTDVSGGPSTAFYKCVQSATSEFAASPDFKQVGNARP